MQKYSLVSTRTRAVTWLGVRLQLYGLSLLQVSFGTSQPLMMYGSSTNHIRIANVMYSYFELENHCFFNNILQNWTA
jgi:hypothetical protein